MLANDRVLQPDSANIVDLVLPVPAFRPTTASQESSRAHGSASGTSILGKPGYDRKIDCEVPAGASVLIEALEKIIEMNLSMAQDQYGDANKAEGWSCVRVAREAIESYRKGLEAEFSLTPFYLGYGSKRLVFGYKQVVDAFGSLVEKIQRISR